MTGEELRAALAPIASRVWPVERLLALQAMHADGKTIEAIAERLDTSVHAISQTRARMAKIDGVIQARRPGWADDRDQLFITLYNEGHSLADIARRMGLSKNAGVGKSHRLIDKGLIEARPNYPGNLSPAEKEKVSLARALPREERLRRKNERQKAKRHALALERAPGKATRPARPATPRPQRLIPLALNKPLAPMRVPMRGRLTVDDLPPPPEMMGRRPKTLPYTPPPIYGRVSQCCWPLGHPGKPDFHFCDKPTDPGRPYCHTHVSKAYASVPAPMSERARA